MPKSRIFRSAALAGLCILAALLCSCTNFTFEAAEAPSAELPVPDTSAYVAPTGDSRARYSIRTTLYYRTGDNQLSSALRLIHVDPEDDPLRLIMESLLETPYSSSGLLPIAPQGTKLNEIRLSGRVAMVDLTAQALSQGEEYFFITRSAIAKTLLGLESVRCVNVLVEGRAVEVGGVPLGALTAQDTNAAMGYIQHMSEQLLLNSEGGFIERDAVLYLPGTPGSPLKPVWTRLRLTDEDPLAELLSAFSAKASSDVLPAAELSRIHADTQVLSSGKRVLYVYLPDTLTADSVQEELVPALIASLSSFIPNIDAAGAYIGQEPVLTAGPFSADADGLFDPQRMRSLAGTEAELYFMAQDGTLVRTQHVLEGRTLTARALLTGLMAGPAQSDVEGSSPVFPQNTSSEDILGIRIADNIAHVNLSADLYGACQAFTARQERALVYAIVNTLVNNLDTVQRVQFYIDGTVAETFAGSITVTSPLMANPGLVQG